MQMMGARKGASDLDHLVMGAKQGVTEARTQLVRLFERPALAIAYARTGNSETAAEVVQEAWLRSFARLAELRQPEKFGSWFCAIVARLAIDRSRRVRGEWRARSQVAAANAPRSRDSSLEVDVLAAVQGLEEEARTVILLHFMEDLTVPEIAEVLDLPHNRVKWRLQTAFEDLRRTLRSQA